MTAQTTTERIHLDDFYPTPSDLLYKLTEGLDFGEIQTVLEPSAGKGDICEHVQTRKRSQYNAYSRTAIDAIEISEDLQHILRGKEFNVIHDDFLTFNSFKCYDLIIANFPFSDGDKHLSKALQMLEKSGGELRCLVNAETIKNPYTNLRETINGKLERLGAEIEYIEKAFTTAERKTDVEVALIKVKCEVSEGVSIILDSLQRSATVEAEENQEAGLVETDFMKALTARFNVEAELGVRLIDEYFKLKPFLKDRIKRKDEDYDYSSALIKLDIDGVVGSVENKSGHVNAYLRGIRHKYWSLLVNDPRFNASYTSNVLRDLHEKLNQLKDYDFNLFNIQELEKEMRSKIGAGVEKAILDMFDEFSRKHHWREEDSTNIHYYNGWKTNKAHKINEKVILPINGFSSYSWEKNKIQNHYIQERLQDIVKVFNYLSETKANVPQLVGNAINLANNYQDFRGMDLRYFETTFYKKGTCHIKFKDQRLLDKFNIFGSQRKGWLPPSYGKKAYKDMTTEEKEVIDDFQGKAAYERVLKESSYYLVETNQLLLEG